MTRWPSRIVVVMVLVAAGVAHAGENLVPDPSFEEPKEKDRWGHVFAKWSGWIYEGECEFRVSRIARTGKHSLLMVGGTNPKIRACSDKLILEPGRYRITAYLRGLDIGTGIWNQTTELMFAGKYMPLGKNGTFGWTPLEYVGEVTERRDFSHPSFGLMAPGYLWVDDVTVERVGQDVPLTAQPRATRRTRASTVAESTKTNRHVMLWLPSLRCPRERGRPLVGPTREKRLHSQCSVRRMGAIPEPD